MKCLQQINEQMTCHDAITTPPCGMNIMADDGQSWQSPWHGYKLDPIASDGYVENLHLVGLSEDCNL